LEKFHCTGTWGVEKGWERNLVFRGRYDVESGLLILKDRNKKRTLQCLACPPLVPGSSQMSI